MHSLPWPDRLRQRLRQQNLPPAYIDRLVEELSDHLIDSQTENTSMDAKYVVSRLGSTDSIAAAAVKELRQRNFAGRHPYLTFVFGPITLVPLLFMCLLFGPGCVLVTADSLFALVTGNAFFPAGEESSTFLPYWTAYCYHLFFTFVPFALAAAMFCIWGRSVGMQRWAMVACGIIAVMAGATASHVRLVDGNFAEWMVGLAMKPTVNQFVQLVAPLAVAAGLLLWTPRRLSPIDSTPTATTALDVE